MEPSWLCVLCFVVVTNAAVDDYGNRFWVSVNSYSGPNKALNVTGAPILQPKSNTPEQSRKYAFRPRSIPLKREEPQIERTFYSQDTKQKTEVLFPGDQAPIATEKSVNSNGIFGPGGPFRPQSIPLIRNEEFQRRSLDVDEEPMIEKPEGFLEEVSKRSISDYFGVEEDDDDDADDDGDETDAAEDLELTPKKDSIKKKKGKKELKKYMLPLLLAYKLKYFALVPVMIGGLVLLVGATGLAGFFFALFAAVMGLQKGSY